MRQLLIISLFLVLFLSACASSVQEFEFSSREESFPSTPKVTPDDDIFPPVLHSDEFENPVPLEMINSNGVEDSPFIVGDDFYFFFTPDASVPPNEQLFDGVTGIYVTKVGSSANPERVLLQEPGKLALDGCPFSDGDDLFFCSTREGFDGLNWFSVPVGSSSPELVDFGIDGVGELHIVEDELFFHSSRSGSKGGNDIWVSENVGDDFYFFFTPDASVPPNEQLFDGVTGIYVTKVGSSANPERVLLQEPGKLALDGCPFSDGDDLFFCSTREGFDGLNWFSVPVGSSSPELVDFGIDGVGELHIVEDELFFHSSRSGSKGGNDIWVSENVGGVWQDPVNVAVVNTPDDEGMPYVSGGELWYHSVLDGAPAIYRSKIIDGVWQDPELIVSRFAAEPTFDSDGNLYFAHHFIEGGRILEADIYVARRK